MEWTDDAIVIGARRHGESSVILEAMTASRGRHLGLVRGGRSRKQQPVLQPGNRVDLLWRARLDELGFGLDLSQCAATGARQDLAYVSPKSGRAVSRQAGAPWRDKMLTLPAFLQRGSGLRADQAALEDAFRLTGFFFTRHVYEPRGIEQPDARAGFLAALRKHHSGRKAAITADSAPETTT